MAFVAIAIQLGIMGGLWLLNRLTMEDPFIVKPRPEGLDFAQTKIGAPVPVVYGTIRVDNGVLVWHGLSSSTAISGGFTYGTAMLICVGTPSWDETAAPFGNWRSLNPPRMKRFWYGDKSSGAFGGGGMEHGEATTVTIPQESGDFFATMQFFDGRATQLLTDGSVDHIHGAMLAAGVSASVIPGYRHQIMIGMSMTPGLGSLGTNPHVAALGFEIESLGPQAIGSDANPAWVLYDLLCGKVWKVGFDPDDIDLPSFEEAASILFTENHGCSLVIYTPEDAPRVLSGLCQQIDAVLFEDDASGRIKIRLIRERAVDFVATTDNTIGRPKVVAIGWSSLENQVRVGFTSRNRDYKEDAVTDQRLANAVGQDGRIRSSEMNFPSCTSADVAAKIAARELGVAGRPLLVATATFNREAYALEPGHVIEANWPLIQIEGINFRVLQVDKGQLADGGIVVKMIQDVFDNNAGVVTPPPDGEVLTDLLPINVRMFDEAPYFLVKKMFDAGTIPTLEPRVMAAVLTEGDDLQFSQKTRNGGLSGVFGGAALTNDVPQAYCPTTATVQTAYTRELEPFDTSTGLIVTNVEMWNEDLTIGEDFLENAAQNATPSETAQGANLIIVLPEDATTGGEIMTYESVTALGGSPKQYRLNRVQRGLADTVPVDHAVGARVYWIFVANVGLRAWSPGEHARGNAFPANGTIRPPGQVWDDDLFIIRRVLLSVRATDFRVAGYGDPIAGTAGIPRVPASEASIYPYLGHYKSVSDLDGALDIYGRQHAYAVNTLTPGATDETAEAGTTWDVYLEKDGDAEIAVTGKTGLASPTTTGVLLGQAGHGAIDVKLHTLNGQRSWQSPRVRVQAAHYRDLLANGSFDYNALLPGWSNVKGTTQISSGTFGLGRLATSRWIRPLTTDAVDGNVFKQTIDITGYKAFGLSAVGTFYVRCINSDANDTAKMTIRALDADDVSLGTAVSATTIGPITHWQRARVTYSDLPAGTAKLEITMTLQPDAGEAGAIPDVAVTRVQVFVGQFGAELLTNPSFDGALTSWTNVTNSFVLNTTNPYASDIGLLGAAQGGAFSSSEIKQEVAIPSGYKYGKAVLTLGRSTTLDLDTGQVILEVLDGGGGVIATATTGAEYALILGVPLLDVWVRRRLVVDLPDAAVTLRVRLLAVRTLGSGNSGACFDDLSLRIFKDLDPVVEHVFDFGTPARAHTPATVDQFHMAWPDMPIPFAMWGEIVDREAIINARLVNQLDGGACFFSDAHELDEPGRMFGYWIHRDRADVGGPPNTESIDAFEFTRASAGASVDLQSVSDDGDYGDFERTDSFTVAVLLRTNELGTWGGACGVLGRRDASGRGWGLQIDASGFAKVVFQGAGGAVSVTSPDVVNDGAPRWVIISSDGTDINVCTAQSFGGTGTAGIGATAVTDTPFRIGRDGISSQSFPGQIARVMMWNEFLSSAEQFEIIEEVNGDPTGMFTNITNMWTSSQAVWVPGPDNDDGATLVRFGKQQQIPIAYSAVLAADGDAYGVVTTSTNTNKVPSFDFTDSTKWARDDANVVLTQGVIDPTGLARGVKVDPNPTFGDRGIRLTGIPMTSDVSWKLIFYAREALDVIDMEVDLVDSDGVLQTTEFAAIADNLWHRYVLSFTWTSPTPTAILRFRLQGGATNDFDLGHVMWFGPAAVDFEPVAIQNAGQLIGDTYAAQLQTLAKKFNSDGEIYVEGTCPVASPPPGPVIASIDNNTADQKNTRMLYVETVPTAAAFNLYDNSGTPVSVEAPIDWSASWTARARWNSLVLPERVSAGATQGVIVDDDTGSTVVTANAYSIGTAPAEAMRIGGGDPSGSDSTNSVIRKVVFRSREEKMFQGS